MTPGTALRIIASTLRIFPQNVGLSLTLPPSAFKLQEINLVALAPKVRLDASALKSVKSACSEREVQETGQKQNERKVNSTERIHSRLTRVRCALQVYVCVYVHMSYCKYLGH